MICHTFLYSLAWSLCRALLGELYSLKEFHRLRVTLYTHIIVHISSVLAAIHFQDLSVSYEAYSFAVEATYLTSTDFTRFYHGHSSLIYLTVSVVLL